jgi:3-phenylpropionate/cinnamic acid dioxygenase small subunit
LSDPRGEGNLDAETHFAVCDLLNRAALALDERDLDALGRCFAPDATMVIRIAGGTEVGPFHGHAAIMELMRGALAKQVDERRHVISNVVFEGGSGGHISVISYLTLLATEHARVRPVCTGVYRDEVRLLGGRWLIAARDLYLDGPF